ncbi:MAG: magnesium chelatase subunit H [Candidatus Jordarchaeales archaeon]
MARIVMVGYQLRPSLVSAAERVRKEVGNFDFEFFKSYDVDSGAVKAEEYVEALRLADVVLLDLRGGDKAVPLTVQALRDSKNTVVCLVGGSRELINLTRMGSFSLSRFSSMREKPFIRRFFKGTVNYAQIRRMQERFEKLGKALPFGMMRHARNYALTLKYYDHPSEENYYNMFLLLLKEYCGVKVKDPAPPVTMPSMAIQDFSTGRIYGSLEEYLSEYRYADRRLVGIYHYGGYHYDQTLPAAKMLAEKLEAKGLGVVPLFSSDLRYHLGLERFFFKDGKPVVECVVDLLWFRLAGGPIGGDHREALEVLRRLNVPLLHGILLSSRSVEEWLESRDGVPPVETVTTVILPELDGRCEPIPLVGPVKGKFKGVIVDEYVPVEDRVERIAGRAARWISLRTKPNSDKKVAIVLYDYPPGEENLGKASYLNTLESTVRLLKAMERKGFKVGAQLESGEDLKRLLLESGAVNSGEWVLTPERAAKLPNVPLEDYVKWFSRLPEEARKIVLERWGPPPGDIMVYGGRLLVPGVLLGNVFIGVQPSRGVHEKAGKQYHGRDIPPHHQYLAFYYWLRNVFGADVVVHVGTHGTLEFLPGKEVGLSGKCFPDIMIADLPNVYVYDIVNSSEASIAKRRSYAVIVNHGAPPVSSSGLHGDFSKLERLILQYFDAAQFGGERAEEAKRKVLEEAGKYGFTGGVEEVYDALMEYKRSLIPRGLHVLGERMGEEEKLDYLTYVARYDRGKIRSLHRVLMEAKGLSYDEALEKPHLKVNGETYAELLEKVEGEVRSLIKRYVLEGEKPPAHVSGEIAYLKEVAERVDSSREIEAVLDALEGKFVEPGPGGDPVRSPEVYPTGRNTYQLDPTNIPSETAWERGSRIAEEYVANYYRKHGRWPRAVSVVLWAFETMKTGGETLAAVFRLLGVKPVWKSIYVRDIEVIPVEELGRPRIDVVVTICGILRDTFYNIVELLDQAFRRVASLDETEEQNFVKANLKTGPLYRIFGPPEGEYATSMTSMVESSSWRSEADLVRAYVDSMRYAYGDGYRSVEAEDEFRRLLSRVDVVTQVRDTVDYEITDLDHYYEFLGGLTKAVEEAKGEKPMVLVADTTREKVKVERAEEAVRRGVVTRLTNPKWLDSMLESGFTGAAKIADRVEYLLGIAATLGGVEDWMWNLAAQNIVLNDERREKMRKENPWAFMKTVSRLLEANKRGYWKADKETLRRLEDEYAATESMLEED